jgi:CelD/BcsL family acetyltransferase involved in cellulose biosynthesis
MVDLELVRDVHSLRASSDAWSALCDRAGSAFARPEWLLPWLASYGEALDLSVVLAWRGTKLVALLPLHEERASAFERALVLLGNDHTPVGQLAIDPDERDTVIKSFCHWALGRRSRWARVQLGKLPTDSADYRALSGARALAYERRERQTHHTDLCGDWESFLRAQSKNFRKQVKKAERAAERHRLRVERLEAPAAIEAALGELAAISQKSWQGKQGTGTLSDPRAAAFYRAMMLGFAERGAALLSVCQKGDQPIGFVLHIAEGDTVHALKSEFDEHLGDCMVGWQINRDAYGWVAARGARTITTGCWITEFKRRWCTRTTPYAELSLFSRTLSGGARYVYPHLSKELAKRALGKPSVARCLPLLDFVAQDVGQVAASPAVGARP